MKVNNVMLALSIISLLSAGNVSGQDVSATSVINKAAAVTNSPQGVPAIQLKAVTPPGANEKTNLISMPAIGASAPDFVSKDIDGKEISISGLRGKIVVLDFWATWCGPCKASLPHTQAAAEKYKDQGVVVLAVCTSDTRAKFEEFLKSHQGKYPDILFACDPHEKGSADFSGRASHALYGLASIPTQFVIGRDGKIADVIVGFEEGDHRLEDALAKLATLPKGQLEPIGGTNTDGKAN